MNWWRTLVLAVIAGLSGCGPDGSAIYATAPFREVEADLASEESFLRASAQFAEAHRLQIAVNRLGRGQFSVFMHDTKPADLNLIALNTETPGEVIISAIARHQPTADHFNAFNSYVAAVRGHIGAPRPVDRS